jgi:hypothetical protein
MISFVIQGTTVEYSRYLHSLSFTVLETPVETVDVGRIAAEGKRIREIHADLLGYAGTIL